MTPKLKPTSKAGDSSYAECLICWFCMSKKPSSTRAPPSQY
ncbi:hypothetical protein ACFQV4_30740 [Streptomyces thermocarboxydus]